MFDLCGACTAVTLAAFAVSWALVWSASGPHERYETLEID